MKGKKTQQQPTTWHHEEEEEETKRSGGHPLKMMALSPAGTLLISGVDQYRESKSSEGW